MKKVLIIDDDLNNRELLFYALQAGDYELLQAASGAEVKATLEAATSLDMALIDIELPDTDGIALAADFRARFPNSILIMSSALDAADKLENACKTGADGYIVKPFNIRQVLKLIQTLEARPERLPNQMLILHARSEPSPFPCP